MEIEDLRENLAMQAAQTNQYKEKVKAQGEEFKENYNCFKKVTRENEDLKRELESALVTLSELQSLNVDLMKANEDFQSDSFLGQDVST